MPLRASVIHENWSKYHTNRSLEEVGSMGDLEGLKASVEKVTADMMEIAGKAELEVEPGNGD